MSIYIYNTMCRKLEPFVPISQNKVKIYACGITVYDDAHIGHAMQAVVFDVIRNYFEYSGYEVIYVRNYTDIDDKIINKANELNLTPLELSSHYITETKKDLSSLGVREATFEPKVSEHIDNIISFIERLISMGFAYIVKEDVLFDIKKFPNYGKLSNRNYNDLSTVDKDGKYSQHDFTLWKSSKQDEPSWKSPWGYGRPGWHIECSAMALNLLGESFDIHGGGLDLIFPHHENEIAQSEALTGKTLANYWIHNGLVMVEKKKMSKSLGNFYSIKDALKKYSSDEVRYLILSHSYSSNIDFSKDSFSAARKRIFYFYKTLHQIDTILSELDDLPQIPNKKSEIITNFEENMNNNFNTAKVLAFLSEEFRSINKKIINPLRSRENIHYFTQFKADISVISKVLGILNNKPGEYLWRIRENYLNTKGISKDEIENAIKQRTLAKNERDFYKADSIRNELSKNGIAILDSNNNTMSWEIDL